MQEIDFLTVFSADDARFRGRDIFKNQKNTVWEMRTNADVSTGITGRAVSFSVNYWHAVMQRRVKHRRIPSTAHNPTQG